jgi:hypothetical protein
MNVNAKRKAAASMGESSIRRRATGRRNLVWCAAFLALIGSIIAWQAARQAEWAALIQQRVVVLAASRWRVVNHVSLARERHQLLLERADDARDSFSLVVHEAVYERNGFDKVAPGNLIEFERLPADEESCIEHNGVDCFLIPQIVSR